MIPETPPPAIHPLPPDPTFGAPPPVPPSFPIRGYALPAWILILVLAGLVVYFNAAAPVEEAENPNADDPIGIMAMDMQGKFMVAAAEEDSEDSEDFDLVYSVLRESLNLGSVGQRQRFVVLGGELMGEEEAAKLLAELDEDIATRMEETRDQLEEWESVNVAGIDSNTALPLLFQLTTEQEEVQDVLHLLYENGEDPDQNRVETLTDQQRSVLESNLEWHGRLALYPSETTDNTGRDNKVLAPARRVLLTLLVGLTAVGGLGFCGLIGLIVLLVIFFKRGGRTDFGVGGLPHGVYAETFALWMVVFLGLQLVAGLLGMQWPQYALLFVFAGFMSSLIVLAWPVLRGGSWSQVRRDIGWTAGKTPLLEPIVGLGGYTMALPLLALGLGMTYLLMAIQVMLDPAEAVLFDPMGGPAHPIVLEIKGGDWFMKLQLLLVASVAAPVVEETMFRGVLYRHLRDWSGTQVGVALSVMISGGISGFLFAAIHPQGWVAIPALMGLAFGFVIVREWRGTLIPSMVIHAVSNGLLMTLLMLAMG